MKMRDEMTHEEKVRLDTLTRRVAFLILHTEYGHQPSCDFEREVVEMYQEDPGIIDLMKGELEKL